MKKNTRSDLAIDIVSEEHLQNTKVKKYNNMVITTVVVDEKMELELGKKKGKYITIEFEDLSNINSYDSIIDLFSQELKEFLKYLNIKEEDPVLIIGLGNEHSTPDSLGPLSLEKIMVTKHLYDLGIVQKHYREVSAFAPGVMGETGLETSDLIFSIVKQVKPKFLIVIDALASNSLSRINKTIQMTDSGINPGSGIGNQRKEISKELLNIPVIAIGIPTVVDAVTIVSETIQCIEKKLGYMQININKPSHKLMINQNYLNQNNHLKDKDQYMGLLGTLNETDIRQLLTEVLSPIGYNLMVTSKEIDFLIDKLSIIIGEGLNKALHKSIIKI